MKEGPAKLAVGDALQPDLLLLANCRADAVILDRAQLLGARFAAGVARARLQKLLGPQQATDVVGAERRLL